jgi:hypothetical protein
MTKRKKAEAAESGGREGAYARLCEEFTLNDVPPLDATSRFVLVWANVEEEDVMRCTLHTSTDAAAKYVMFEEDEAAENDEESPWDPVTLFDLDNGNEWLPLLQCTFVKSDEDEEAPPDEVIQ